MSRFSTPGPGIGSLSMLEPSLLPRDAVELIRSAMASNRKPAPRRLTSLADRAASECGSSGILYTAGLLSIITIEGVLSQGEDPFAWIFGGCSLEAVAQAYRDAADDPNTKAVLVRMNSPGGSCAGNADVQAALRYLRSKKPVHAIANDLACSGGYYTIALAHEIVALSSSMVGSVGVFYGPFFDVTGALEKEGVEAWSGKTGSLKGAGFTGVEVTDEMKAHTQRLADDTAIDMFAAVAEGRKMTVDQVKAMQAGCFAGAAGVAARLVDRIVPSFHDYALELQNTYAQAPATAPSAGAPLPSPTPNTKPAAPTAKESKPMPPTAIDWSTATDDDLKNMPANLKARAGVTPSAEAEPEKPATNSELKAAFPSNDAFRLKCLDEGLTMSAARDAYAKQLEATNAALSAKNTELETKIAGKDKNRQDIENKLGGKPGGAPAVAASNAEQGADEYEAAIIAKMQANPGMVRGMATGLVNRERPDLRSAFLAKLRASQPAVAR